MFFIFILSVAIINWSAESREKKACGETNSFSSIQEEKGATEASDTANVVREEQVKGTPYTVRDELLICKLCQKTYEKEGYMNSHFEKNHKLKSIIQFKCDKCGKPFDCKKKLTRHTNSKTDCSG